MNTNVLNIFDYSEILKTYGLPFRPYNYYWQVGSNESIQGWTIWLSVIQRQFEPLFHRVIPILIDSGIPFRILRDYDTGGQLLEGSLGYPILGMIIGILPNNDTEALEIAQKIISSTSEFRGPSIPAARHLQGIVYARYGGINPTIRMDATGQTREFIQESTGNWVPDPYSVPFILPKGISWPFSTITTPYPPKKRKLLNFRYYPLQNIKPDAKGSVLRGLYFKHLWEIRSCIIKQARHDMLSDTEGRDTRDRLRWQFKLYQDLHRDIPMPQVFDYFEEDGDSYLAIQFIDGISITGLIEKICKGRCWRHLTNKEKSNLTLRILEILQIIYRLHEKGYVHRDIQPDNFIVNKKRKIFLIDMELAYSVNESFPTPPYQLGTQGHMSPEQLNVKLPTSKEDIFGIGALIINILCCLPAMKINAQDTDELIKSINFFTNDESLSSLVAACCSINPNKRPSLIELKTFFQEYRKTLDGPVPNESLKSSIDQSSIDRLINNGISGLTNEKLHANGRWISLLENNEEHIGNVQISITLYEGWHTGISGVLWTIAIAFQAGYSVDACLPHCEASWVHLQNKYFSRPSNIKPGLYFGSAGIAMAISETLFSEMLIPNTEILEDLQRCFSDLSEELSLSTGVAGQGISLLNAKRHLDINWCNDRLSKYLYLLIKTQLPDGSWNLNSELRKSDDIPMGIDKGVAGIAWFLLHYYESYKDEASKISLLKALDWLKKQAKYEQGAYFWTISSKSKSVDPWSVGNGLPGIALLFIRAYEILGDPIYKQMSETSLETIPPYPVRKDTTLATGLSGLSEVYMEAYVIFKDQQWQERSNWIQRLLMHSYTKIGLDKWCWQTTMNYTLTADLGFGSSGVIHSLIRSKEDRKIRHPLIPNSQLPNLPKN